MGRQKVYCDCFENDDYVKLEKALSETSTGIKLNTITDQNC